jgi:hypothetical protein
MQSMHNVHIFQKSTVPDTVSIIHFTQNVIHDKYVQFLFINLKIISLKKKRKRD